MTSRHLSSGLLALVVCSSVYAADIKEKILNIDFVKNAGFSIKEVKDLGDVYVLNASHPKVPKMTIFVSKDLKTIIVGNGFTQKGEVIDFPVDMAKFKKEAVYTVGNGDKEYFVFTDPECPYCQKFEQVLPDLQDNTKLHVFLFPLEFHKNAISMSKYILSQKTNEARANAMKGIANGKEDYKSAKYSDEDTAKYQTIIDKNMNIARELGVQGTPSVYDASGKPVQWPTLLKAGKVPQL